jgi:hypothetical protein
MIVIKGDRFQSDCGSFNYHNYGLEFMEQNDSTGVQGINDVFHKKKNFKLLFLEI